MLAANESGDEQVISDKNDPRVDQKLIDEVNGKLKDGRKGELTLAEKKRDFGGGFLLQRGKIRTNVSIGVLVEQARKDLEIELAKDLFGKGADAGRS
jgi:V/A-type H+-transporting ATPase subunit E